jgi:hypothetical protein
MKRLISIFLCIVLVVCLIPAANAADITFLAVNDSIPVALTSDSMPFYANGLLYVPLTLFDTAALNVVPLYDSSTRTLTMMSDSRSLTFDLDNGTMTNENGTIFTAQVISRSGVLFVPAIYCAYHFGIEMSMLTSQGGYSVARFTTGAQVYDDVLFIEKANNLIEYRANQYLDSITPEQPSASTGDSQQTATGQTPEDEDEPEDEPEEDALPAVIYLAITNADSMRSALQALEQHDLHAAFFFQSDEIEDNADLIRCLFASGQTVGLIADGTEQIGNERLDRILTTKTLCYLSGEAASDNDIGMTFHWDAETQPSLEDAVLIESTPQLYVVDSAEVGHTLSYLLEAESILPQLRETTQIEQ